MSIDPTAVVDWCNALLKKSESEPADLEGYLRAIPPVDELADLPQGTRVLVRGDLDAGIRDERVVDDTRPRSMVPTLRFGIERDWVQIVFGHRGRDPGLSLKPVADCFESLLDRPVTFIPDWMDESGSILDHAAQTIAAQEPGGVVVMENTRRYSMERALWKAKPEDVPALAIPLAKLLDEIRTKIGRVQVNEGFSASNRDVSSAAVPLAMDRVALGTYLHDELQQHVTRSREAQLVIFSGLKIEKLTDLEGILHRGRVRMVLAAGSLAMALKQAAAELDGAEFCMGKAGDPQHSEQKYFIPPQRVAQAKEMIRQGRSHGVEFVLPVDFVLADGSVAERIPPDGQQLDVGPATSALFEAKAAEFVAWHAVHRAETGRPAVAFHNGVFGKFEEPRFEAGTQRFMAQLKRLHDAGVEVYVGGGEGGAALEKYGSPDWVTHVFTAGGTILKALGTEPIPYLKALWMACNR